MSLATTVRARRGDLALVGLAILAAAIVFVVAPRPALSYDEAKYLAIGRNALAGLGPLTDFGGAFLPHSPLYPMLLAAPQNALGFDAVTWGWVLNFASFVAIAGCTGWLARPWGRWAVVGAVIAASAWSYQLQLALTARLDVPEAALSLLYLTTGMSAASSGRLGRALLAGCLFGIAFLVKESALAFAPAPFLAAWAIGGRLRYSLRAGGITLLMGMALSSWWFAWFADHEHTIFALGITSRLLPAITAGLVVAGLVLIALGSARGPLAARIDRAEGREGRLRAALPVALAAAWAVALTVGLAKTEVIAGSPLFNLHHLVGYARTWARDAAPVLLVGLGALALVRPTLRGDRRALPGVVALICGLPWIVFVAAVGEPPRNYLAQVAILLVLGVAGWVPAMRRLADLPGRTRARMAAGLGIVAAALVLAALFLAVRGQVSGSAFKLVAQAAVVAVAAAAAMAATVVGPSIVRWLDRPARWAGVIALAAAIAAGGTVAGAAVLHRSPGQATSSEQAAQGTAAWIRANVPAGATIAFGSVLANETGLELRGQYALRRIQATIAITDPTAPLGLRLRSGSAPSDWIAVDLHPRQDSFLVVSRAAVASALRSYRPGWYVYVTGLTTATPSMVDWLATAPSMQLVWDRSFPAASGSTLEVHVFRVLDPAGALPDAATYTDPQAVGRLVDELGTGANAAAVAQRWLARVHVSGSAADSGAAIDRLKALAAR